MRVKSLDIVHSWLNPALEAADSATGQGVFAKRPIRNNDLLTIFGGHVMPIQEEPVFPNGRSDLAMQIQEDFVFGSKFQKEIENVDCFNHSYNPNSGIRGQIFLVSTRNIEVGEEICFDYGTVISCEYRMICQCGSPNCRKIITGNDWMLPELQVRYDGYFQWYLQDKIKQQNNTHIP